MNRRSTLPALAGLLALAPWAAPAAAQVALEPVPVVIPQDSVQIALARFQELQQEFGAFQQQVIEASPDLLADQAEVSALVEAAVDELDPTLRADMETRMPAIQQEAQAAQAAANTARLQELEQEFVGLRNRAQDAESTALERPEIKSRIEAFEGALRAEMTLQDPSVAAKMTELETLAGRLDATLNGG